LKIIEKTIPYLERDIKKNDPFPVFMGYVLANI
jgi:hypothetical protein